MSSLIPLLSEQKTLILQGVSGLLRRAGYTPTPKNITEKDRINEKFSGRINGKYSEKISVKRPVTPAMISDTLLLENKVSNEEEQKQNKIIPMTIPIARRINQIRGHGIQYEDSVTVTVTALLDPPPHYILRPPQPMSTPSEILHTTLSNFSVPLPNAIYINQLSTASVPGLGRFHRNLKKAENKNENENGDEIENGSGNDNNENGNENKNENAKVEAVWAGPMVGMGGRPGYYSHHCRGGIIPSTNSNNLGGNISGKNIKNENNNESEMQENQENQDNIMNSTNKRKLEPLKDVFDKTAREEFEKQFCSEIAMACCLPAKNVRIEEVRILIFIFFLFHF